MDKHQAVSLHITAAASGQRLDHFLAESYPEFSRSYFNKLIKPGFVLLNKAAVKSGYVLKENDRVDVVFHREEANMQPADIALDIVFEDDHIIVINKPAGMTVHPGRGTDGATLVNALLHHSTQLANAGDRVRPGIVHRLDKNTSGLLVVAKTDAAHHFLQRQFLTREISRTYWALVWGKFETELEGMVHGPIARSKKDPTKFTVAQKGKEAITHYRLLHDFRYISLLELKLETGRTHQIRVHMNHIHHPVLGDETYNGREGQIKRLPAHLQKRGQHLLKLMPRQALHARYLTFIHPASNERVRFEAPLPEDFATTLEKLPRVFMIEGN